MLRVALHRSSSEDGLLVVRSMEGLAVCARQPAGSVRPTRCSSQGVNSSEERATLHGVHPATALSRHSTAVKTRRGVKHGTLSHCYSFEVRLGVNRSPAGGLRGLRSKSTGPSRCTTCAPIVQYSGFVCIGVYRPFCGSTELFALDHQCAYRCAGGAPAGPGRL